MKIIFTYSQYDDLNSRYIDYNMMLASLKFVNQLGYKTILFTENKYYNQFKTLPYSEIRILDDNILNNIPRNIWALGKLVTFSQIKEPFCHIDFDVFMQRDIINKFHDKKLFSFHTESWRPAKDFDPYYKKITTDLNLNFKKPITHNCAIIGGTEFDEINQVANLIINYTIKEKKYLYSIMDYESYKKDNNWLIPVLIEQLIFMNLCKEKIGLNKIPVIIEAKDCIEEQNSDYIYRFMKKNNVYHLWGDKTNFMKSFYTLLDKSRP